MGTQWGYTGYLKWEYIYIHIYIYIPIYINNIYIYVPKGLHDGHPASYGFGIYMK